MVKYIDVKEVGTAKVIVDIVRKGNPEIRPAYPMKPRDVAIHNTGNSGRGAGAEMHNRYIHNLSRLHPRDTTHVSWHFSVDDKFIYQHIPMDESAWHTGDGGGSTSGNRNAIGIEICMNPDMNYKQAEENAILLAVYLMKKFNINIQNVRPHQFYSGKFCPAVVLKRDGSFTPFRNRINAVFKNGKVSFIPKAPSFVQTDTNGIKVGSKVTLSKSASKYATGQTIPASVKGKKYTIQQIKGDRVLLKEIVSWVYAKDVGSNASTVTKPKPVAKPAGKVLGLVDWMNANKMDSSYSNRAKLAGAGYRGTEAQNIALLKKLKGGSKSKPVAKPSSRIKSVGQIRLNRIKNFTYIYSKPNGKSKTVGTANVNSTFNISGSVTGWYEVIHRGKRAYIKAEFASRI